MIYVLSRLFMTQIFYGVNWEIESEEKSEASIYAAVADLPLNKLLNHAHAARRPTSRVPARL